VQGYVDRVQYHLICLCIELIFLTCCAHFNKTAEDDVDCVLLCRLHSTFRVSSDIYY